MDKEFLSKASIDDLQQQRASIEMHKREAEDRITKIETVMTVQEELGYPTDQMQNDIDVEQERIDTFSSMIDDIDAELGKRATAKLDRDILPSADEVARDISHVEGEQRSLFVKALQEGNGERCAKMAEDCIMDYLGNLGCEQPLREVLAPYIRAAIRLGIAKYKY